MKFDLKKQLIGLDGQPATQTVANGYNLDGSPKSVVEQDLTVGLILKAALNHVTKEKPLTLDQSVKRGKWIMAINKGDSPDFKVEEQAEIKTAVLEAGFGPIIVAQIDEIIEAKGK